MFEDGALFKVEQGTTLKLGNNVDITVASDARATIEGTASQPVMFTSLDGTPNRGDWGTVTLAGDSNTVEYTTVEGGDWGLKFYGNPSASRPVWTGW